MSPLKATTPSSLVDNTAERRGCKYVSGFGSCCSAVQKRRATDFKASKWLKGRSAVRKAPILCSLERLELFVSLNKKQL